MFNNVVWVKFARFQCLQHFNCTITYPCLTVVYLHTLFQYFELQSGYILSTKKRFIPTEWCHKVLSEAGLLLLQSCVHSHYELLGSKFISWVRQVIANCDIMYNAHQQVFCTQKKTCHSVTFHKILCPHCPVGNIWNPFQIFQIDYNFTECFLCSLKC